MSDTKIVTFQVVRQDTWYPEYEVPAHLEGDELIDYINDEAPDSVFDEMRNKSTLETETYIQPVEEV
jgi:hypothetical protein